jgi:osmoprotectant transport system permease protein
MQFFRILRGLPITSSLCRRLPACGKQLMPLVFALMVFQAAQTQAFQSSADDKSKIEITIGSKSFTESVILGEIGELAVKDAGYAANHRKELGGTNILFQALRAGGIDAYPEYTGTISEVILESKSLTDEETMRAKLAEIGIRMSRPLGFNNTYAIGMHETRAKELGLIRVSQLKEHPKLRVGFSDEFMARDDGWPGMQKAYDLPYRARGMDHAIAYQGVASDSLDITDVYTTDAEIAYNHLTVLKDDKKYFPDYYAVWLYRDDLEKRAPQAVAALLALEGQVDTPTMIALNKGSKVEQKTDHNLAAGFLNAKMSKKIPLEPDALWDKTKRRATELFYRTMEHLMLVAISLSAAVIFATPLGVLAYRWKQFGHHILSVIGVLQTIPSMALLVALVPILNLGAAPAIVALFIYSLLPIVRNTHAGLSGISAAHRETAEVLGLSQRARLWMIELPLASPSIFSGIKTAAVINVGTATIGALVGAGGYGQPILTGIRLMDWGLILLGAIPAGLMALGVQSFFSYIERFVVPKGLRVA